MNSEMVTYNEFEEGNIIISKKKKIMKIIKY